MEKTNTSILPFQLVTPGTNNLELSQLTKLDTFCPIIKFEKDRNKITKPSKMSGEKSFRILRKAIMKGDKKKVIILPTGSSPEPLYERTVREVKKDKKFARKFRKQRTANMDEYDKSQIPEQFSDQSYAAFMGSRLFVETRHPLKRHRFPDSLDPQKYDRYLSRRGVKLLFGGIGTNRHLAFNEPGSLANSRTRVVDLKETTRQDNSRFFGDDITKVPTQAVSIGLGTILEAEKIVIIVNSASKLEAIRKAFDKNVTIDECPAAILRFHPDVTLIFPKSLKKDEILKEFVRKNKSRK